MTRRKVRIYTRRGDDGTTALRGGKRIRKDDPLVDLLGTVDEAQAFLGLARSLVDSQELDALIVRLERDLWIVMAEIASGTGGRRRIEPGVTAVSKEMVDALEGAIDAATVPLSPQFAVPGENRLSATLDVARTVVRRAERCSLGVLPESSMVGPYLNRLSDLCWMLARSVEADHPTNRRSRRTAPPS